MSTNALEIQETDWTALRQHMARDAIIMVAAGLDLLEVAGAVACDDQARVSDWISRALVSKPTAEQLAAWEKAMGQKFRFVIVSPFVLVQIVDQQLH